MEAVSVLVAVTVKELVADVDGIADVVADGMLVTVAVFVGVDVRECVSVLFVA